MPKKSPLWEAFHRGKDHYKGDKTHFNAYCKACIAAYVRVCREREILVAVSLDPALVPPPRTLSDLEAEALLHVAVIPGKLDVMVSHLKKCKAITPDQLSDLLEQQAATPETTIASISPTSVSVARPLKRSRSSTEDTTWTAADQAALGTNLCRLFVALRIPWNGASNPELHRFLAIYIGPDAHAPDRRVLSGPILESEVARIAAEVKKRIIGKLGTGSCDGWKSIAKIPVVTSLMTVDREPHLIETHNMSGLPKTGDQLLEIVLKDITIAEECYGIIVIAWCTDDGPDGKKMRRLLALRFPWMIVIVCWAHQINLVVGDILKVHVMYSSAIADSLEVIKWFNNHDQALSLLRKEQELTYDGKYWSLLLPVLTRWTAHYHSLSRLLKIKAAIVTCVMRHKTILLGLAGRDEAASRTAGRVVAIVENPEFWIEIAKVQAVLEPLAIAANITQSAGTRLDHVLLTFANLTRIYSTAGEGTLLNANEYFSKIGYFSPESMQLDLDIDLVALWMRLDNTTTYGQNNLVRLAIRILSVVANSAGSIIREAEEDEQDLPLTLDEISALPGRPQVPTLPPLRKIPLKELFSFADESAAERVAALWKGGLRNLEGVVEALDVMQQDNA
ncbi:hypothetical protein BV25DRAFT_1816187 [Artomyces pyxidatus]|uniref:Uncharacterized protein n=1 Tax=Artomyces pyxidatus TaxID=48021 RepID=A0ACB8SEX1_9AGAM|nr:hypothetical protein BV25DRAFT_1816187 [Artomyces pyxidatus]